MIYRKMGNTDVRISILSLGGHEYLPNGRSRGFNENLALAVKPGYIFEGFGILLSLLNPDISLRDSVGEKERKYFLPLSTRFMKNGKKSSFLSNEDLKRRG